MNDKYASDFNIVSRDQWVVCHRMSDEFTLDQDILDRFADWLDNELLTMDNNFRSFVTPQSLQKSIGR